MKITLFVLILMLALSMFAQLPGRVKAADKNQKVLTETNQKSKKKKVRKLALFGPFFNHLMLEKTVRP